MPTGGEQDMGKKTKFYLVAADALPEIFLKVAEAKRMLHAGEVSTAGEAARQVGISRSAFYKYRDSVQPFNDMKTGRIITFYALLKDNPGVLSNVLSIFAGSGANILTINQSIPTNGCAAVTISAETSDMRESLEELIASAAETAGVVMAHGGRTAASFADGHAAMHTGKELNAMPYNLKFWYGGTDGTVGN